ncbi:hypothetical protein [Paraburkholderia phenazinium]|uniref:hypothetical protein n=1 Tax=Paraburkholderia phenazinium TaxID=60549 RepID=UPI00158C1CD6|nr:hypothetical protein [Paraburkholderia phenazinium]
MTLSQGPPLAKLPASSLPYQSMPTQMQMRSYMTIRLGTATNPHRFSCSTTLLYL